MTFLMKKGSWFRVLWQNEILMGIIHLAPHIRYRTLDSEWEKIEQIDVKFVSRTKDDYLIESIPMSLLTLMKINLPEEAIYKLLKKEYLVFNQGKCTCGRIIYPDTYNIPIFIGELNMLYTCNCSRLILFTNEGPVDFNEYNHQHNKLWDESGQGAFRYLQRIGRRMS